MSYATLSDLKTYLGITGTGDDALLNALLARATAAIDVHTGRTFSCALASVRYFDPTLDCDGPTLYLDRDLCSITSVVNGDTTTIAADKYVTLPRNSSDVPYYAITLKGSSGYAWDYVTDPENAISITGHWAYSQTPPQDVVQACVRLAAYMYRAKDSQVYDVQAAPDQGIITVPQGIPRDVLLLLAPYRRRV